MLLLSPDHPLFDNKCREPCGDLPSVCGSLPYLKLAQPLLARLMAFLFLINEPYDWQRYCYG